MKLRAGTRGSDLALWQTRHVAALLKQHNANIAIEEVIIQTHGEKQPQQIIGTAAWPIGGFVREIEAALSAGDVDFAVHSYKDMPSIDPPGLIVAAVLERGPIHDCLIARDAATAETLREILRTGDHPHRPRIGTSSPRRTRQLREAFNAHTLPLRGNVPTRLRKLHDENFDAVCLAAAGLDRLELDTPHRVDLPLDRFPTAPAQGAIAVQVRQGTDAQAILSSIDHAPTRRAITAERAFLLSIGASCQTPVAATATLDAQDSITLHVQLFGVGDKANERFEARETGDDPLALGQRLAKAALAVVDVS